MRHRDGKGGGDEEAMDQLDLRSDLPCPRRAVTGRKLPGWLDRPPGPQSGGIGYGTARLLSWLFIFLGAAGIIGGVTDALPGYDLFFLTLLSAAALSLLVMMTKCRNCGKSQFIGLRGKTGEGAERDSSFRFFPEPECSRCHHLNVRD
ncbi:hypothetical protein IC614_05905 [Allosphingosinicella flava]|uniref:Uncharacterized protein n=1 Tax=Allosphingosinicella flava TaxID=2771430 RepID=A0A7T2GLJ8_9SPHN|nr:hypothetical protein [Sphingosinicella flava]QPQ56100.1 hypothetical protein IC614_05905 [Sphingosinicella flava]